ncbi:hypothetical protein BDA96_04G339900 [Sorghum bicolor]|uniref:non-specific serine/threonine protein kinase n=1 Tax=Sorghum bicolor TaxID=4558 RepID=A0A921R8D6_SORBI|nr:hypothetical protein BDA96_04G339900 [Sorghum bicolor]
MLLLFRCFVGSSEPSAAAARSSGSGSEKKAVRRMRSATARLRSLSLDDLSRALASSGLHAFTQAELSAATRGLSSSNFIGEGGFGPVYRGFLDERLRPGEIEPQHVAVKYLDADGPQGHREWLAEVVYLGMLKHPHLVKLIGYGCQDEQRMLVYEYMARGSLEHHLFKNLLSTLPWCTRLKIAVGAAKGLAFLHEADTPVIYRDFKASNILLDSDYTAKLSDFGLAKEGPQGDDTHVTTRVMGTHGYAAPEYILTGHLTAKSDVYSFGVVLLELLSGRRSVDKRRRGREQHLVDWARPYLRHTERLHRVMDPCLDGQYSAKAAHKAAMLAYNCLHSVPKSRPTMRDVVDALQPLLAMCSDVPAGPFVYTVPPESEDNGKADDDEAVAAAAAARKKCLASAVHSHAEGDQRTTLANQRCARSEAGHRSSSASSSPKESRDRGA